MKYLFILLFFVPIAGLFGQATPFELSGKTHSATYDEAISWYQTIASKNASVCSLVELGEPDAGRKNHLFIYTSDGVFNAQQAKKSGKPVLLINNGIHPGEPDGVDASMLFVKEILENPNLKMLSENLVILIIPVYNIGGALRTGCCFRANQNGPWPHGFRGNSRNLDLNRDFMKRDAGETKNFHQVILDWDPDVFVDTHVTDGADYPYVMTLISTLGSKLNPALNSYLEKMLLPDLYKGMAEKGYEMAPYVNTISETPDSGIVAFYDSPRYATGYTSLFNCLGFTTETHMVKPFSQRVDATHQFLLQIASLCLRDKAQIKRARMQAFTDDKNCNKWPLKWELDTKNYDALTFKGYESSIVPGAFTSLPITKYDQTKPWEKEIPFFNHYLPKDSISLPKAYIIPACWHECIERLQGAGIEMKMLAEDKELACDFYSIQKYETTKQAYEGHYLHYNIQTETKNDKEVFHKGDWVIDPQQKNVRFLVQALEPRAEDSYFAWNLFDEILMQKEYYSSWLFEEMAAEMVKANPAIKDSLDAEKLRDPTISQNQRKQLDFVYKRSEWYEKTHMRYPVARLMTVEKLKLVEGQKSTPRR